MSGTLAGKVALITGSTKGIGRAIARELAEAGAKVVVSSRTEADVARTARELDGSGSGAAHGIPCDVRDPEACRRLVEGTVERFGGLDILVNNAGLGRFATIQEMDPEDWDIQLRTNLDGVFHVSRAAVPHLVAGGGGWIFNIGSLAGRNAFSGGVAYNASKFGLRGMTEAMMLDLRDEGVRVTLIMPGSVNTHFFGSDPDPEGGWKLQAEDISRVVLDLLAFPDRALPSKVEIRPSRPPNE
ncbi:MAG: SDR family oxidoreductase [Gemmatimonadales bacterium]|nr:MAG: SDR family oxidoreductase [Gemmatimonadales bacterium]